MVTLGELTREDEAMIMKRKTHLILLIIFLVNATQGQAHENEELERLVDYVESTMALLHPSSAGIVVSKGDEVIFETYLTGSFEGLPETKVNHDTLFYLASCTKPFSSGVLLMMAKEGTVHLDDPVSKYLPEFQEAGMGQYPRNQVTLRQLASHTSGLQYPEGHEVGPLELLEAVTEPGSVFRYSSTGMMVLQRVLEVASGKNFEHLMQDKVLLPLGLENTRYLFEFDPGLPLIAAKSQNVETLENHYFYSKEGHLAGSGLYSTAREVNRYAQLWALKGKSDGVQYLPRELVEEATRTHGISEYNGAHYGLLWWVFPEIEAIVMSGATHSVSAVAPEYGVAVTVMRNYYGTIPEGFVFHEDKKKLLDSAIDIGKHFKNPGNE